MASHPSPNHEHVRHAKPDLSQIIMSAHGKVAETFSYARFYEAVAFSRDGTTAFPDGVELFFWLPKNQSVKLMYADGQFGKPELRLEKMQGIQRKDVGVLLQERISALELSYQLSMSRLVVDEELEIIHESERERRRVIERLIWLTTGELKKLNELERGLLDWLSFLEEIASRDSQYVPDEVVVYKPKPTDREIITLPLPMTLTEAIGLLKKANYELPYLSVRCVQPRWPGIGSPLYIFDLQMAHGSVSVNMQTRAVRREDLILG